MKPESQALYLNAIPLLATASLYLLAAAVLTRAAGRERRRLRELALSLALFFPCAAIAALILGLLSLREREPLGGHAWLSLAAILVAAAPALAFFARRGERGLLVAGPSRIREGEEATEARDREREDLNEFTTALARARDVDAVARVLLDRAVSLLPVEFASLTLVSEDGSEGVGVLARDESGEQDWWRDYRLDLRREPSGIASAAFEAAPVVVYDLKSSSIVNRPVLERVGAKSAAWLPLLSGERVIAVLAAATTRERRSFSGEELALLQALAGEAALALERTRSLAALERALERERLVARISRDVRSQTDVDAVLAVAVTETGTALGVSRCYVGLAAPGGAVRIEAEWRAPGAVAIASAERLADANLAVRERRTVAVADVSAARELADSSLGGRETLLALDARAVLSTPLVVYGSVIGVFGLHRPEVSRWAREEIDLAEAVARELGLAIQTARLLEENELRLRQQAALLKAAQAVASELEPRTVLARLVEQVAELLGGDAADFYVLDPTRNVLRCAAVRGLPEELVGFEFPATQGLAGEALVHGTAVLARDYTEIAEPVAHAAYGEFRNAVVAPVIWGGTARGVLGVGARAGGRDFGHDDVEVIQTFAGLASLALRNSEAFEERSRQARVQRGFFRIASVLAEPLALTGTLEAVAQAAADALGGDYAAVLMPRGRRLELAGWQGLPDALRAALAVGVDARETALRAAAAEEQILAAPRVVSDERFEREWRELAERVGYSSLLAIPVHAPREREEAGTVLVFFKARRSFTDDDVELARQLAGAARGALDRSALYEEERRARALAQQLARTGSLLATELDPAAVLEEVVRQAPRLVDVEACVIRVLDADELVVTTGEGDGTASVLEARSPATGWLSGDVFQSRAPLALADAAGDERLRAADPLLALGYRAYLGVPLAGPEGSLHGVLSVYGKRPKAWRDEEIEALRALAANASAALANAELYQRVAIEKEQSAAILANIADGIVAVDREGQVVLWNRAAEQITGVPTEEALGRTPQQVLGRNLEAAGTIAGADRLVSILRGGDEVWLSVTEAIMRDPAGAVAGRIYAFRDISAERLVEQMKSDFVSTVSHELRRPLTSIYGFAETLLRRDVLFSDEERRVFLGYIASESERLTTIVDALLNVARLDTGDLQVTLGPTDVGSLVSEAVAAVQEAAAANGHRFVLELPDEPVAAEADSEKLRLVLSHLLDNAIKYSPNGGNVTVAARRRRDTVEVTVADEGVGIPQSEQERIFRKFYRGDGGAGRTAGGTGLGLFIAQGLVTAMGGRIWVSSVEGEGSRFTFELPLAQARALAGA